MRKLLYFFIFFVLLCGFCKPAAADLIPPQDHIRAGLFTYYGGKSAEVTAAELPFQGNIAQNYNYLDHHTKEIADLQEKFYTYLKSFGNILQMAACIYAIYWEVTQVAKNLKAVQNSISICPTGVFATALYTEGKKNIYSTIMHNILDMTRTIYSIIGGKMSQKDRMDAVQSLQGSLHTFNNQLLVLANRIRYTSLIDLWDMVTGKIRRISARQHGEIALDCMKSAALRLKEKTYTWGI